MEPLKNKTGIKKIELYYQLMKGLKMVDRILKERYPEQPNIATVTLKFSTTNTTKKGKKLKFLMVGFENSKTAEYTKEDSATFDFDKAPTASYHPVNFDWKEKAEHLHLKLAGYVMRRVAEQVLLSRQLGIPLSSFIISDTYSVTKSKEGAIDFSFFQDSVTGSIGASKSNKVTQSFSISFEVEKPAEKPKKQA